MERIRVAGRAEAALAREVFDPLSGKTVTTRGRLALEPPDRLSLFFPATGERIAVRADGGEWLQPSLEQMLRLGAERAAAARRWWEILDAGNGSLVTARMVGSRRFVLLARASAAAEPESAWVTLDRDGLPARLEVDEGTGRATVYRLSAWRFMRARGAAAFTLEAPRGYEVVSLP